MTQSTRPASAPSIPAFLASIRDDLRAQRELRAARKQLRRELASYTTDAEINDLEGVLDQYDEAQVADIREILQSQRSA